MDIKYDFLIFDLDGTLVDSQEDIASSVNAVRKECSLKQLSISQIRSYLGSGINALMDKAIPEQKGITKSEIVERFKFYYGKHLTDTTIMYDGVEEMLTVLKNKKKAILSNKTENFCLEIVKRFRITDFFVKVWGGDSIGVKKPDPKPILDLIKLTNSSFSKTVMIGDSANDFLAAKAAAISSIAVLYGYSDIEQIKKYRPNYIAKNTKDIVDIVL